MINRILANIINLTLSSICKIKLQQNIIAFKNQLSLCSGCSYFTQLNHRKFIIKGKSICQLFSVWVILCYFVFLCSDGNSFIFLLSIKILIVIKKPIDYNLHVFNMSVFLPSRTHFH